MVVRYWELVWRYLGEAEGRGQEALRNRYLYRPTGQPRLVSVVHHYSIFCGLVIEMLQLFNDLVEIGIICRVPPNLSSTETSPMTPSLLIRPQERVPPFARISLR